MLRILLFIASLLVSMPCAHAQVMVDPDKMAREATAPYDLSFDQAAIVQKFLYENNYDLALPDGKIGPQSRAAIAKWQKQIKHPETGLITREEYDRIAVKDFSTYRWAAISASTDGAYASVWDRLSRQSAESEALNGCVAKSSKPDKCTTTRVYSSGPKDFGWIASVHCKGQTRDSDSVTTHWLVQNVAGEERNDVTERAFTRASEAGYARSLCEVRSVVEARGRHK